MEYLASFLAETMGTLFLFEGTLLVAFVLLLNVRRALWAAINELTRRGECGSSHAGLVGPKTSVQARHPGSRANGPRQTTP